MRRLRPFGIVGRLITPRFGSVQTDSGGTAPQSAYADDSAYAGFSAKPRHDKRHGYNSLGVGLAIASHAACSFANRMPNFRQTTSRLDLAAEDQRTASKW